MRDRIAVGIVAAVRVIEEPAVAQRTNWTPSRRMRVKHKSYE
jgi:hypothetical protein